MNEHAKLIEPFEQGRTCSLEGRAPSLNPYHPQTAESVEWLEGYDEGAKMWTDLCAREIAKGRRHPEAALRTIIIHRMTDRRFRVHVRGAGKRDDNVEFETVAEAAARTKELQAKYGGEAKVGIHQVG